MAMLTTHGYAIHELKKEAKKMIASVVISEHFDNRNLIEKGVNSYSGKEFYKIHYDHED